MHDVKVHSRHLIMIIIGQQETTDHNIHVIVMKQNIYEMRIFECLCISRLYNTFDLSDWGL